MILSINREESNSFSRPSFNKYNICQLSHCLAILESETAQINQSELIYLPLKNLYKILNYVVFNNPIFSEFALQCFL